MKPPTDRGPAMFGFEGKSVPPRLARWLREGSVCGVVLFSRNVETPRQVRDLCREIRAAAGRRLPPPLIAVDQEGGRVTRFSDPGFTRFPPAGSYALFGRDAPDVAEAVGCALGRELRAVGADINFAPVLDVRSNTENPVIGDRAMSADPDRAAELGIAFARGTLSAGVVPVGKHFPGHGHTSADSHDELPVVRSSPDTLLRRELHPFRRAVRAGIPALMTAHVLYPALDRDFPATLSRKILGGLLRRRFRFRGVLFSDALEMKAISGRYEVSDAAVRALIAGCDIVLVCRGEKEQEETLEGIARARSDDGEFRKSAASATLRISRLRSLLSRPGTPPPGRRGSLRHAGAPSHRDLSRLLFERWDGSGQASPGDRSGNIGEG